MEFLSVRDFGSMKNVWQRLEKSGELVVTNNGKPTAILVDIDGDNFEETLATIRQAKAMRLLNSIRSEAAERGFLSDAEIEIEINAARAEVKKSGEIL